MKTTDRRRDASDVVRPQAGRANVDPRAAGKRSRVDELGRGPVHRASSDAASASAARPSGGQIANEAPGELFDRATRGTPEPLPYRREMETIFGADFSSVRAYPGRSAEMRQLGARGASAGERIAFGPSDPDRELVAHELTHVLQDRRTGGSAGAALSHPADATEREASAVAGEAAQALGSSGEPAPRSGGRLADRITAAPTLAGDDAASGSSRMGERAANPTVDGGRSAYDDSRRTGRADGADNIDASDEIHAGASTAATHAAHAGTEDGAIAHAEEMVNPGHGPLGATSGAAHTARHDNAVAMAAARDGAVNGRIPDTASHDAATNTTTAADAAAQIAPAGTANAGVTDSAAGTAITAGAAAQAASAGATNAAVATQTEKAEAARCDAANAAKPDAAKPDAAKPDAAKPDAAKLNAAHRPASPPHAGSPVTGAKIRHGGAAIGSSQRSGDGAAHALANITPSNLASVVRSVDQSWIADAHAAHATLNAKSAGVASAAPGAAPIATTPTEPSAGQRPKRPGESTETAHPAAHAGAPASAPGASAAPGSSATRGAPAVSGIAAPTPNAKATSVAAQPQAPQPPANAVSAGRRPRVDLSAEASPARIDRKRGTAARVLVDETAGAHVAAATTQPRREPAPLAPHTPAPPIAAAPVTIEEPRFLASVPLERRPSVEAAVAPVIARRVADVQTRIAASQQRTDSAIAELDAQHTADEAHLHATIAARRAQGHAQIDLARQAWQTDTTRVQQKHQRAVDEHHARTQAQVATMVHTGEQQVDTSLTHSETDATGRLAAAHAQADAMIASAHARADAARAAATSQVKRDGNGGGDPGDLEASARADADALLARVMDLIHQMMQAAQSKNTADVIALRQRISDLLEGSSLTMDQLIDQAMADLPAIAHYYKAQIDQLMTAVDTEIAAINMGIARGNSAMIDQQMAALASGLAEKQGMLSDVTSLSKYTSIEDLRTAFGIDFDGGAWSESSKEIAVLGAVLTERAFRDSAPAGYFQDAPAFGSVFQDVMGPVTMNSTPGKGGAQTFWDNDRDHYRIDWYRNVSGNLTEKDDLANLNIALGLDPKNESASLLHNVIHEFGHVFDGRARKHGRIDTDMAENNKQIPADAKLRAEMSNEQHPGTNAREEQFADLFLNFVTGGFKDDKAGRQTEKWFENKLYGNTAPGSIPQDDWGWVDIARDRGDDSKWITYGDQYYYSSNVYLEDVAAYFGIDKQTIIDANRDKLVHYKDGHWELARNVWLTIPGIDRRHRPTPD